MTFRMPYNKPGLAANAAMRMITGRVAKGYWPYAYAMQRPVGDLRTGAWTLYVTVKNHAPKKPSDKEAYAFEFVCADEKTAREAVDLLHQKFYGEKKGK